MLNSRLEYANPLLPVFSLSARLRWDPLHRYYRPMCLPGEASRVLLCVMIVIELQLSLSYLMRPAPLDHALHLWICAARRESPNPNTASTCSE